MQALATKIPFQFETPVAPALEAANESYGEVTVGGLTTACLSRDGLTRTKPSALSSNRPTSSMPTARPRCLHPGC
jgi:hypothetical protein